jgi:hypothetical protein
VLPSDQREHRRERSALEVTEESELGEEGADRESDRFLGSTSCC